MELLMAGERVCSGDGKKKGCGEFVAETAKRRGSWEEGVVGSWRRRRRKIASSPRLWRYKRIQLSNYYAVYILQMNVQASSRISILFAPIKYLNIGGTTN